jgi:hypothetical protein
MAIHTENVKLTKEAKKELMGLGYESSEIIKRFPAQFDKKLQYEFLMRAVANAQGERPR